MGGVTPYHGGLRQRLRRRSPGVAALIGLAIGLAGCSPFGLPFGPDAGGVSNEVVGSIPVHATLSDSVDPSDWEAVRRTIAAVPQNQSQTVNWSNPDTGSTGAVTALAAAAGASCRPFATTVSDPHGVRRYSGQVCRQIDGRWRLKSIAADDALFS